MTKEQEDAAYKFGEQLYHKLCDTVTEEIYKTDSTPLYTARAIGLCFTRTAIAIVGYDKANDLMVRIINEAMKGCKPKEDKND